MFKILSTYICRKKIYKMQHLEGSGTPVLYIGRRVLNRLNMVQRKLLTFTYMSTENIKLELKEVELGGADWFCVTQDIDQLLGCTNIKMKPLGA
jgi:hypothetical protein